MYLGYCASDLSLLLKANSFFSLVLFSAGIQNGREKKLTNNYMQNKWLFKDVICLCLFIYFFNVTHYVTHLLVNVTYLGIYIKKILFYIHFFGNNHISFHEKETFTVTISIRFERLCYSQSHDFPCRFLLRFLIEVLLVFYRKTMMFWYQF